MCKKLQMNWNFAVFLLLESRNVAVQKFFTGSVHVHVRRQQKLRQRPQNACGRSSRPHTHISGNNLFKNVDRM